MKRYTTPAVVALLLAASGTAGAADRLSAATATAASDKTITVPISVANADGLMAMDIPLTFSEGVTLKEVNFEGTRTSYFDMKLSNINNEKNQVVIGLVTQLTPERKPFLAAGEGPVANLVFTVDDPSVSEITINSFEQENPTHSLVFIYMRQNGESSVHERVEPKFGGVSVSLVGAGGNLPTAFALEQNYPNPFNPSTEISFALPSAGKVELSIYNLLGQKVNTLVDGELPAGNHVVTWNGTSTNGASVASGVYLYRIVSNGGSFVESKKMMLVK